MNVCAEGYVGKLRATRKHPRAQFRHPVADRRAEHLLTLIKSRGIDEPDAVGDLYAFKFIAVKGIGGDPVGVVRYFDGRVFYIFIYDQPFICIAEIYDAFTALQKLRLSERGGADEAYACAQRNIRKRAATVKTRGTDRFDIFGKRNAFKRRATLKCMGAEISDARTEIHRGKRRTV